MAVVYAFLADGLEEVECLATADVLIRAGVKVKLVSITGKKEVKGAHGFGIHADALLHEVDPMKADLLFLPGGMPGTKNLMACKPSAMHWCRQMLLESAWQRSVRLRAFWGSWGF